MTTNSQEGQERRQLLFLSVFAVFFSSFPFLSDCCDLFSGVDDFVGEYLLARLSINEEETGQEDAACESQLSEESGRVAAGQLPFPLSLAGRRYSSSACTPTQPPPVSPADVDELARALGIEHNEFRSVAVLIQ